MSEWNSKNVFVIVLMTRHGRLWIVGIRHIATAIAQVAKYLNNSITSIFIICLIEALMDVCCQLRVTIFAYRLTKDLARGLRKNNVGTNAHLLFANKKIYNVRW